MKTGLAKMSTHSTTWQFKTIKLIQRPIKSLYLFYFKSRNQDEHVARLGDLDNIFSRQRPRLSRLRRPGAVT